MRTRIPCWLAVWLFCVSTAPAGGPDFVAPILWMGSDEAGRVVVDDFDENGTLDLAVALADVPGESPSMGAVEVWLGDGSGNFEGARYLTGWLAFGIASGDVNLDGHRDLVSANYGAESISVFLGNGDGTFAPGIDHDTGLGSTPIDVAIGDFDEDGLPDLLVQHFQSDLGVLVLLGNGDGTFVFEAAIEPPSDWSVAVGDFDEDGHEDFVVPGHVYLGQGDGSFVPGASFPAGRTHVAVNDLDEDGHLDLVASNDDGNSISVLFGRGDGTFDPQTNYPTAYNAQMVAVSDLDGDGLKDLVVDTYYDGYSISLFFGLGNRMFSAAVLQDTVSIEGYGVATGDFDGDGREDLVRADYGQGRVIVLPGNGDGTFATPDRYDLGESAEAQVGGDFDEDGHADLAVAHGDSVSILLGAGDGTLVAGGTFPAPTDPTAITAGDLDGDGHQDLAVAIGTDDVVSVYLGVGDGTFSTPSSFAVGRGPVDIAVGHLNGDGHPDLVVVNATPKFPVVPGDVSVLLGLGNGSFAPELRFPVGVLPVSVAAADFNGDLISDVVVANEGASPVAPSSEVSVLLGVGNGTLLPAVNYTAGNGPTSVAAGDFDGDGDRDLAVALGSGREVAVLIGNGDGTFAPATIHPAIGQEVTVGDVNGDENDDVVGGGGQEFSVLLGDGAGGFAPFEAYAAGENVVLADLDEDGRVDVATTRGDVLINLNLCLASRLTLDADHETLRWGAVCGALSYNVYRGEVADLVDLDMDGLADDYGACINHLDGDTTDTELVDTTFLPVGEGFFYLVAYVDSEGEDGLGTTSSGLVRDVIAPCP